FDGSKFVAPSANDPVQFIRPEDLAAMGAASNFFLTLNTGQGSTDIALRFFQTNLFLHDDWRIRPNLTLSYGLRYEYNSPPRELNKRIENTFNNSALDLRGVEGLKRFIDARSRIFDPDRNNFAPRVSLAYSPNLFGKDRATVFRAGFGMFYDQILGAVVSQSRNVYPSFLTVNFAGGFNNLVGDACPQQFFTRCPYEFINPSNPIPNLLSQIPGLVQLVQPGTLNTVNQSLSFAQLVRIINSTVRGTNIIPPI